jgi:Xaa-Pro aminopeptidase
VVVYSRTAFAAYFKLKKIWGFAESPSQDTLACKRISVSYIMFQTFVETAAPEYGPTRLNDLRKEMTKLDLDGFIVPRADMHLGEYVAPRDERLSWLTGFTGSAGFCIALHDKAGVFVDGRYRVQVRAQVDPVFTPVDWPEISLADWLLEHTEAGATIGFDPWLMPLQQLRSLQQNLDDRTLTPCQNLIDTIWTDQPKPPMGMIFEQPDDLTGDTRQNKITQLAEELGPAASAVLTLPDSIAWLLNIRGRDIPRNPVPHALAMLHATGRVSLFIAPQKIGDTDLGPLVDVFPPEDFLNHLSNVQGAIQVDPFSVPTAITSYLETAGIDIIEAPDPCVLPKACKTPAEIAGTRKAHLRDGAAMVRFLFWLDQQDAENLTEIDVVRAVEAERRATNELRDISFDTISGAGPNGAIVHYRVTEATNRHLKNGELLLVDSGGQYQDGTTDITRTIAIGSPGQEERDAFTRVLRGMITLSRLRWPTGLNGRDVDILARTPLWEAGLDYGHGTGHGVGSYLCVHEGPQRIARTGNQALLPGMILSNEPGFYREGAFGIRLENLIVVAHAPRLPQQTIDDMLCFETLTWAPIDRHLIDVNALPAPDRQWLNDYHAEVLRRIGPLVDAPILDWLEQACAPV